MNTDENQMLRAKQGGLVPTKLALAEQYKTEVPSMAGFTDAVANARARTGKLGAKWPDTAKVIYTGMQLVLTVRRLRPTRWPRLAPAKRPRRNGKESAHVGRRDADHRDRAHRTVLRHRAGPQTRPARGGDAKILFVVPPP